MIIALLALGVIFVLITALCMCRTSALADEAARDVFRREERAARPALPKAA